MKKYEGVKCPVCSVPFTAADDVVVCPDCGAPHHRACWQALGHCGCTHLHAPGQVWQVDAAHSEQQAARTERPPQEKKRCAACHAENDATAAFCSSCGAPLLTVGSAPFDTDHTPTDGIPNGFHLLFDPLGGVPADEPIDEVPASRLGMLVGRNSAYYIPRFRELFRKEKRFSPNFTAMVFDVPWFFFRKMYLQGIGVAILEAALLFPAVWAVVQMVLNGANVTFSTGFWVLYYGCSFLQLLLRLLVGFTANTLYLHHCIGLARRISREHPDEADFRTAARKRGGTAPVFIYVWLVLSLIYYFANTAIGLFL